MAIDQTKVGRVVAEQMEALEADYGDESEIGDVCTIVEVRGPHGSHVRVRGSNPSPHVMIGLLRLSEAMFVNGLRGRPPGEAEEES